MNFDQFWSVCGYVPPGADHDHIYAAMKCAWNHALDEAFDACMSATPNRAKVKAIGEAAHYAACADAVRKLRALDATSLANGDEQSAVKDNE